MSGKTLSLRAKKSLTLGVDRHFAAWQLGAELQAVGVRFDDAVNSVVLPGYALVNLNASTQLGKDWKLVLRADNAAGIRYQEVAQFATPGRMFYAGLTWQPR
jgi:vitamin B12 transporter